MLRIIHAADFHLGAAFTGLPPELAARRRRELSELPERLRLLTLERQADLMLLSGDLFDRPYGCEEEAGLLARTLSCLDIPVFIAPGNHDYYCDRSPYATVQWPDNVHIFDTAIPERFFLPEQGCVVYGAAFTAPRQEVSLLAGFRPGEDSGLPRLLCMHGELSESYECLYNPISREKLREVGIRYAALGHNHSYGGLQRFGSGYCAWPGCPEGHGFDETGDKGVLYVEIMDNLVEDGTNLLPTVHTEFVSLCRRRYLSTTLDVSDADSLTAAVRRVLPEVPSPDLIRITLTGEAAADTDLKPAQELLERYYFYASLINHTTLRHELWNRAAEQSLTGEFLRLILARMETANAEERQKLELAARYGLAALEGRDFPQ